MGLTTTASSPLKALCLFFFVLGCSAATRNIVCPFDYLFHTGDGFFDVGNAILQPGGAELPANHPPYGKTNPGHPSGRWSDGLLDIDMGGVALGFPKATPSLSANTTDNSIIFAVAGSPILGRSFFRARGIKIQSFAAPLSTQMEWFRNYLKTICSTREECSATMTNSLYISGDIEANDIRYALVQGKTVEEVRIYVPIITKAQISVARDVIKMGGTRIVLSGSAPLGCFPYILTKLASKNPLDYDDRGCLRKVNDIIKYKNEELQKGVQGLIAEYPNFTIVYADIYGTFETILEDSLSGPNKNETLKACCGTGGKYNFDSKRFCGTNGVSACVDPSQYLHWDGIHLTQNAHHRLTTILQVGVVPTFKCRASPQLSLNFKQKNLDK